MTALLAGLSGGALGADSLPDMLAPVSRASQEFLLELPLESAVWACREAVVDMGWGVESIEPRRLVIRRGWWGFSRDVLQIEILLAEAGPAATRIAFNGSLRWERFGRELVREMNRLRNAMEVAAHRSSDRR
jgi:hypothetical protein